MQQNTTVEILQDLLRIDTQNPPGNELPAVEYIGDYCRKFSIDYQVYTYEGVRANIIARIGPQSEESLVVLGHTDVVKADPKGWRHPPFAGVIEDGWLYGRGALDMKYVIAASMSVMVRLKAIEKQLKRGIIFVFSADEENGSRYGMQKLLQDSELREELSGKIVLNEGGGFSVFYQGECYYLFETGQKSVGRLRVTVPKEPETDPYFPTMVHERTLVWVLNTLSELHLDEHMPATTAHLKEMFSQDNQELDADLQRLITTMSSSMITPTVIQGGARNPHLDRSVKAVVDCDCRLLPGISEDDFLSQVKEALSEHPVEVELLQFTQGYEANIDKNIVKLLERSLQERDSSITALVPFITPGSNDGKYLKPLGCDVLGFAPLHKEQTFPDILPRIHGVDERISLQSVDFCEHVLFDVCSNYLAGDEYVG